MIINADASQVYADLRIISARPSEADEADVAHRLYGVVDGAMAWSAADWAAQAKAVIAEVHAARQLPILVGGTGLYLRTLLDGIAPVPSIDPDIRASVRNLAAAELQSALAREDPSMAARLNPADRQRLCRALEVIRSTGRSLAEWQSRLEGGIAEQVSLRPAVITVDRETLYQRCNQRFDAMIIAGALSEVAQLGIRNLSPALPVMKALGVPQLLSVVRGETDLAVAVEEAKVATRQYAKRQTTWFRNQTLDWPTIS